MGHLEQPERQQERLIRMVALVELVATLLLVFIPLLAGVPVVPEYKGLAHKLGQMELVKLERSMDNLAEMVVQGRRWELPGRREQLGLLVLAEAVVGELRQIRLKQAVGLGETDL